MYRIDKILLVSNNFRWYNECFANAFRKYGCDIKEVIGTNLGIQKHEYFRRLQLRLGCELKEYKLKKRVIYNNMILSEVSLYNPDAIVVLFGYDLLPQTLSILKEKNIKLVLSIGDRLSTFCDVVPTLRYYDLIYSYDFVDVETMKKAGYNAKFMGGCYDTGQYFPISTQKDIDISFVGSFAGKMYSERKAILKKLSLELPQLNYAFYGEYARKRYPIEYTKFLLSKNRKAFKNKELHFSQCNELYNRSKICLNINALQTQNGWGSRLTEILGTNSFQLVDSNEMIEKNFEGGLVTFYSYEDMKQKILYYLEHSTEREQIAQRGYEIATEKYTYEKQVKEMLSYLFGE